MRHAGSWLCLLLATCVGGAALAATDTVIAKRQDAMKSIAAAAKTIDEMFREKRPYDAAGMMAAASLIRERSGKALLDDFPPGSTGGRSEANEKIWTQWDEFAVLADRLSTLGAALAADAARSPDAIGSDMRMKPGTMAMRGGSLLGGRLKSLTDAEAAALPAEHVFHLMLETCTSCHAKFRVKRN